MKFGRNISIVVGRDYASGRRLCIEVGAGWRDDAPDNEIPWRYWWKWSPRAPKLIWRRQRIVGICCFGRCRIWGPQ